MSLGAKHVQQSGDGDGEQKNIARPALQNLIKIRVVHQALVQPSCTLSHHEVPRLSS